MKNERIAHFTDCKVFISRKKMFFFLGLWKKVIFSRV